MDSLNFWVDEAKKNNSSNLTIFLVGLKADAHVISLQTLPSSMLWPKKKLSITQTKSVQNIGSVPLKQVLTIKTHHIVGENVEDVFARIATVLFEKSLIKELDRPEIPLSPGPRYSFHVGKLHFALIVRRSTSTTISKVKEIFLLLSIICK